jgi:RNA-directed DNA polymerase
MSGSPNLGSISTRLRRIAQLAREDPERSFKSLAHYIDEHWLQEAYSRTRKDGAVGVDGTTAKQYAEQLGENLRSLLARISHRGYEKGLPPVV